MSISIEKNKYIVNPYEFTKIEHKEYSNLKLYNELGLFERLIGLIKRLKECYEDDVSFISYNTTHGGFIPINLINQFISIYLFPYSNEHIDNIKNNINNIASQEHNRMFICELENNFIDTDSISINISQNSILFHNISNSIFITKNKLVSDCLIEYKLHETEYFVYVGTSKKSIFNEKFKFYIANDYTLHFDNLINLCIMVKNAGPQFEQMLNENLHLIDRWTILDTGSTDETIDIINRVLVGKKEGKLYQEPFINFRDSRNRLLDLAGEEYKFILMLDDTYIEKGDLRGFLNEIRSDQYSNSFTLYIHSEDTIYSSNRIIKSNSKLRYIFTIHEVINDKDNINVIIPENKTHILDTRFDYMEKRTMERKQLDLKLLYEEMENNPNEPRVYYYLAQTYNLLKDYEKAYYYYMKRCEFTNSGFIQERFDAAFELARICNFKLNKSWDECEKLYINAFKIDETRPESLYFIGIHYYLENNFKLAYKYFKQGFEIGFPQHCQYCLKPTLSFHFLPKFLTRVCYQLNDYKLGLEASKLFLLHNQSNTEDYEEMLSWYNIYEKLTIYSGPKEPKIPDKPILCFVADGGFKPWTGSTILTSGVGGSETFIIEIARYIKKEDNFDVYVFCNTPNQEDENFEGVNYRDLNKYYEFINTNYVKHCIISRYSEYLPLTFKGYSENVYFIIHDLTPTGNIIPTHIKLKKILCLTEWHVQYFTNIFPDLKSITSSFYYGIDDSFKCDIIDKKIKNKFIYSSYPNRGLLELLQMWPKIYKKEPTSTLHIFSDIYNKWSNEVEPEKMLTIQKLLNEYKNDGLGIYYHGWVTKKELAEAWITSDIWFYPCTFMETFCLTALEAASSKTFCITNNLAALQNTVADRGVIINGNPLTEDWQEEALNKLFSFMDDSNILKKHKVIEMNYEWAKSLSWETQASQFLTNYIYPNNKFEYKGMYNWTNNLPQGSKDIFLNIIYYFNNNYNKIKFGKKINVLEIGTYTGISLIEIIKLIPNSFGIGLDLWSNYKENELLRVVDNFKVKESFYKNINTADLKNRITGIQINSTFGLLEFIKDNVKFDFIYVDGSHLSLDCYCDLVLSWQILEKGGIMAIDDYTYKIDEDVLDSPYHAVNHFLKVFETQYKLLSIGYRVFLEKN